MKYFKKANPDQKVFVSTGEWVKFEPVSHDLGVYPPEGKGISEWLIGELRACIARSVGGMTEITLEEYNDLLAKKKAEPDGLLPPWREEFKLNLSLEKHQEAQRAAALAKQQSTQPIAPPAPVAEVNMENQARLPDQTVPAVPGQPAVVAPLPRPTASKPKVKPQ